MAPEYFMISIIVDTTMRISLVRRVLNYRMNMTLTLFFRGHIG